jgi:hypothetical protein
MSVLVVLTSQFWVGVDDARFPQEGNTRAIWRKSLRAGSEGEWRSVRAEIQGVGQDT